MRILRSIPLLIVILFAAFAAYNNQISPHIFLCNFLVLILMSYFNIYIHETGHVLAAKLVGIGVKGVIIGRGKKALWAYKIFGIPLYISNSFVGSGLTLMEKIDDNLTNLRYAFFVLGGTLFQSLLIFVCYACFGIKDLTFLFAGGISISTMFIFSGFFEMLINLVPRHVHLHGMRMANDGLLLLKIPFLKKRKLMDSDIKWQADSEEIINNEIRKENEATYNNAIEADRE